MSNSTILITGVNRGIGLELTRQFPEDGWQKSIVLTNKRSMLPKIILAYGSNSLLPARV